MQLYEQDYIKAWDAVLADVTATYDGMNLSFTVTNPNGDVRYLDFQAANALHNLKRTLIERAELFANRGARCRRQLDANHAAVVAGHPFDLALRAGGSVGTPLTYGNAGAVLRWGTNLPSDLPVTHISLGPPRDGFRGAPGFGWYAWIGADGRAVGYNTFIEGSTFAGGAHVKRRTWGGDLQVGVAAAWTKARVGFTFVQRSREFEGQRGSDRFGQVAVSFAY